MRVFPPRRAHRPSTLEQLSSALQQYFNVPQDMPDAFVKAFARLDSSEHQKVREAARSEETSSLDDDATAAVEDAV
jgi:hypothetical protein